MFQVERLFVVRNEEKQERRVKMKDALREVYRLVKTTRSISRSVVAKLTNILPLVRRLDQVQKDLIQLRKTLQIGLKELGGKPKPPDQKLELLKDVAHALEPAMVKKRELIAKLKEQGVRLPNSFDFYLSLWKKEGLFNTTFGKGWYSLSPKGRNLVGLPPKPSSVEPSESKKSRKEIEDEKRIALLEEKLQKAESEREQLQTKLALALFKLKEGKEKLTRTPKGRRQTSLSQLDLVVQEMYRVKPRKLKKTDIKALLDRAGKMPTPNSLIVLLTKVGSKGLIVSSGERGDMDYYLTPKGEARAEKINSVEQANSFYALTREQLTEQDYDVLEKVYGPLNIDRQRYFKVPDQSGKMIWLWWGLADDFITPDQPLLGHLFKYREFPESVELPLEECFFVIDGVKVVFDPLKKADDRILKFVEKNGRLPNQTVA